MISHVCHVDQHALKRKGKPRLAMCHVYCYSVLRDNAAPTPLEGSRRTLHSIQTEIPLGGLFV